MLTVFLLALGAMALLGFGMLMLVGAILWAVVRLVLFPFRLLFKLFFGLVGGLLGLLALPLLLVLFVLLLVGAVLAAMVALLIKALPLIIIGIGIWAIYHATRRSDTRAPASPF